MQLYKRGKYFWVRFTMNGIQHRVGTKEVTKTAAGARAMEIIQAFKEQRKPVQVGRVEVPLLREFATGWFSEWLKASSHIADGTREYYEYGLSLLKRQPIMSMVLDSITEEDADMIQTLHSASTHNCALRTLRRMLNLAARRGLITKAPKIHLLNENRRTSLVEPEIEAKVAAELNRGRRGALRTALYLMLDAGMRPIEIAYLKVEHVNFARGLIYVHKSKTPAGKRCLPLSDRLKRKLFAQIGDRTEGWVFPSPKHNRAGMPINSASLTSAWRVICKRVGIPPEVKLYCARHTFGTDAMDATKNAFLVMKALGHTELSTTERYQHHDIAQLGEQMNLRNERRAQMIN